MGRLRGITLAVIGSALACEVQDRESDGPGWAGSVEETEQGLLVRNPPYPMLGERALTLEEDLVLGDTVDARAFFFFRTKSRIGPDGRIHVWDPHSFRIQVFGPDGTWRSTVGREGEGPGEIASGTGVDFWVGGDGTLFVFDRKRLQVFDGLGGLLATRLPPATLPMGFAPLKDGTVLWSTTAFSSDGPTEEVWRVQEDGTRLEILWSSPSMKAHAAFVERARYTTFHPELVLEPTRDGGGVFGYPTEYRFDGVFPGRKGTLTVTVAEGGSALSADEKEAWIDRLYESNGGADRMELEEGLAFPDPWPFYDRFFTDDVGNTWVSRILREPSPVDETVLDLFDRQGIFLYRLRLPVTNIQAITGGFVFSRRFDGLANCDQVVRHRIVDWPDLVASFDVDLPSSPNGSPDRP